MKILVACEKSRAVTFVFGDAFGLTLGTISLDSERIKNREATYKSCLKNDTAQEGGQDDE